MNNDWLVGGDGNDRINGSGGDNVIWGDNAPTNPGDLTPQNSATGGDDQLSGLGGNDVFYGSGGNDLGPEQAATAENVEHFHQSNDCSPCAGDDYPYAVNEFGAPGMSYKDWVATQSVDAAVIKNHAEFVKDRVKTRGVNLIGATYSPDSHTSDQVHWIGLRRPQAVRVDNPTQVPDMNLDWFDKKAKFTWDSSQTSTVQ